MRKPIPAFTVETFEYVEAGPDVALLRLSGVWRTGIPEGDVELVARVGGARVKLAPLPAPAAADGTWRAAYSASAELLGASFELEAAGARTIALPAPVEHGTEPEVAPQPADAVLAEELRRTVGKTEELIERLDDYEHGRVSFEEELAAVRRTHANLLAEAREEHALELAALRDELDTTRRELAAALDDVDALNDHVDTLHDAHSLELGAARQQRDAAEQRVGTLEHELADASAGAEALRSQLDDRAALIEHAREEVAHGVAETADLHAAVMRLRDAIAVRAREVATAQRRFARTPEALDRSRDELRRDAERIAALERQAEALRDAIHSQLPYSLHASPLQEALPLPEEQAPEVQSEA